MLSRISRSSRLLVRDLKLARSTPALPFKRFQSTLKSEPTEVFTKISDDKDPQRSAFFQYSWGSWLSGDKAKKAQRETRFSIEGAASLFKELHGTRSDSKNVDKSGEPFVRAPLTLKDGTSVLSSNLTSKILGDGELSIKSIASIHEGKHHRVYKISLNTGKELVLRIPYKLESDFAILQKIKSEVATLDFLNLKLNASVPKVLAYGTSKSNQLNSPFILMEFIEGDLLMKNWDPLAEDSEETQSKLKSVIDPIADFQEKALSVTFNKFGSLYFHDDVPAALQADAPYDGEENPLLKNRWRIGPSIEKSYAKNKNKLSEAQVNQFNGPWSASKPLELISSLAGIEIENLRNEAVHSNLEESDTHKQQIDTFENLKLLGSKLFNPASPSIMNVEEMFKPRLYLPDLDPLNTIVGKDEKLTFFDFEYASIKPFILTNYPSFVAYQGVKIYNLEEDIPGYSEMDEVEQQQYQFIYYKTRNERLWELALNERRHDLIAIASPHIKVLKSPYLQALEFKTPKDYLYIESCIIQLRSMWEAYVSNSLCNSDDAKFPIEYDEDYLTQHEQQLMAYQNEVLSSPFVATGGWIPQDMFNTLKEQGMIVEDKEGNYKIDSEKVLDE
ncbi:altered inheritance of mitochondria protein 9, mitochondrial [Suhomyces tanzawaensis NRRL Y-17324]|uniref:Altered inheritance of mitochondria protein 9, mitochondrial n=1 Tax=Suhomyces tanzawaensis NRRL Y-17324 TaxID=984487 RepID=A0A1E4SDR9_9ASCO|nr:altered inheritance of mitochondria protein 9, mitochondrial [Suhomyces tanzawaensis NRRL Y-17324]ODV77618.1 altered inheritance of mitochondria protein 9, mitochondrial [Suhomyces tanzawaensis NRRL Y-17324]